jgi:hypothetical protein
MAREGVPLIVIQRQLGHNRSSPTSTTTTMTTHAHDPATTRRSAPAPAEPASQKPI